MTDIVYGARCVWWDSIDKVDTLPSGLPCCPFCRGVLFQIDEAEWDADAKEYEDAGHEGYVKFIEWLRGKCFLTQKAAEAAYAEVSR